MLIWFYKFIIAPLFHQIVIRIGAAIIFVVNFFIWNILDNHVLAFPVDIILVKMIFIIEVFGKSSSDSGDIIVTNFFDT